MRQTDERAAWEVVPFESIGPLRWDMTKAEVAATLGEEPRFIDRTRESFRRAGAQPGYDDDGLLAMVLVYDPVHPVVRGVELREGQPLGEAVRALEAAGLRGRDDHDGSVWFEEDGVVLYAPNGVVEGAGAHRRGYSALP